MKISIPIKRHVKQIVWLLMAISVIVSALSFVQAQALSAVRAYVHGESLWAKAQKDAVLHLYAYLNTPEETLFQRFEHALRVNLSYQRARMALQQAEPDWQEAREGFLAAGSHPDDVDNMIRLFLWFGDVSYMKRAIVIWQQGDANIARLRTLADRVRANHTGDYRTELDQVNHALHELELAFSSELGKGARWIGSIVVLVNFMLLLLMLLVAGGVTRKVIAEISQTETRLRHSENRFRSLHDSDLIGIIGWGTEGQLYDANDTFLRTLGYDRAALERGELNWRKLTPEQGLYKDEFAMQQIAQQGYCDPFIKEFRHKEGHLVTVLVGGALMSDYQDQGIAFVLDRSKQKQLEDQLRLSAIVLDASLDGILICDAQRHVLTANDAYCAMTGFSRDEVIGSVACFCMPDNQDDIARIETALAAGNSWQGDTLIPRSGSKVLPVRISLSAVPDDSGQPLHFVAIFTDISVRKALERNLNNRAHHDPLTGLANRSLLSDRLDTAISRAQRSQQVFAVLFVDLDKFKPVNDVHGHETGDQLLRLVAQRLQSVIRESDTLGRLGGDEFVAVVEGLDEWQSATRIAQTMIELLARPFTIDGKKLQVGCSIGIAVYPSHGATANELLRAADVAMYKAKSQTDRRWSVSDINLDQAN